MYPEDDISFIHVTNMLGHDPYVHLHEVRMVDGNDNKVLNVFTTALSTPRFMVRPYNALGVILSLREEDLFLANDWRDCKVIINLDRSDAVDDLASKWDVLPLRGGDALFWAARYILDG